MAPVINSLAFALPIALCCISICFSFRMLRFPDLGLTGAFIIGTYAYGVTVINNDSILLALTFTMACGAAAGALTGFLHYRLKINSLLSGIATVYVFRALAARLALNMAPDAAAAHNPIIKFDVPVGVGRALSAFMPWSDATLHSDGLPIPHAVLTMLAVSVAAAATAYFAHVKLGVVLRAFGDNREAAIEGNFPVGRLGMLGLALAGVFAALGGAALMFTNAFATIDSGNTVLIESFAAFFLGDSLYQSLRGADVYRYSLGQVVLTALGGTAIYQFLRNVTQVLATRVAWLEATDYGFAFAIMLILVGHLAKREERAAGRPVPIY